MVENATVFNMNQIGLESTPGDLVAATRRLAALGFTPAVNADINMFRPAGQKYATLQTVNREWVQAGIEGQPTYNEIVYPLASILTTPTVAQIMDGVTPTGAFRWEFEPSTFEPDDPLTFTIEQGSSVRAHRFGYGLVTELSMDISRSSLSLGGSLIGTRLEDDIVMTDEEDVVVADLVPILPDQIDVFLNDTWGAVGTTKLGRALSANTSISDRFNAVWVLDSSKDSFAAHVEIAPTVTTELMVAVDADGMELLSYLRSGGTKFGRIRAIGPRIYDGAVLDVDNQFILDFAGKVSGVSDFSDSDGLYAVTYTFTYVHESTFNTDGGAFKVEVINDVSSL